MMYTLVSAYIANTNYHMGRATKATRRYYANRLGTIPPTYNSVVIPRATILDTDCPYVLPKLSKVSLPLYD